MFFSIQIFQQVFYHFIFLGHAPTVRICKPGILYINFFKKMVRVHNLWLSANLNWATKNRASLKKGIACCFSTRYISISDFSIQWKSSEIGIFLINLDICHLGHTPLSYFHTMSCQRAISVFTEYYSMWNLI